jgi:beta-barrel assembly-enhancing protease
MVLCPYCRNASRPGAKFCSRCGQSLIGMSPAADPRPQSSPPPKMIILYGGALTLLLLFALVVWALAKGDSGIAVAEVEPTRTLRLSATPPMTVTPLPGTTAVAPGPTASPAATATLGPLKIPGTDIEIPCITDEEEIEIGKEIAVEVEREFGIYRNAGQSARVTSIGQAIVPFSDRPHLPYTFTLLDTDEINAFAVPGGFIYVTRGMLDFVENDDELAGVIGHEIAHVARRHGAQQLEALALVAAAAKLLLQAEPRMEDIYQTEEGELAAKMTAVLLLTGWSRQNEFEADEYGTIYMAHGGYNPQAVITLFNRMERTFPEGGSNPASHLLSTHPPFAHRVQRVETVISENDL